MPGGRRPNNPLAAPTSTPVPVVASAPLATVWGLAQTENLGAPTVTDLGGAVGGPGSLSGLVSLPPQRSAAAGVITADTASPQDDPDGKPDPTQSTRDGTPAMEAVPELAFSARLLAPAPVASGGTTDPPANAPAAALISASLDAGSEDVAVAAESGRSQQTIEEILGSARSVHTALRGDRQSDSQNTTPPDSANSPSNTQEEGHNTPAPDQRKADVLANIAGKGPAVPSERTAGGRGENEASVTADMESAWSAAAPAAAEGDAPSALPPQPASQTGPVIVEPPEPPPASHDISLHLADGGSGVDIRMAERAGEIRVTVHTPDRDLANSMRADLPDLVGKLRQGGFQAEAWRPAAATQSDAGRRDGSDGAPQEHSPGGRREGRPQQPQQQQPKNQARWDGEWKSTLEPAQEPHI
ncbi:MAG: hypothetical protein ABSG65_00995 [Bryobacteraceae bacterium]